MQGVGNGVVLAGGDGRAGHERLDGFAHPVRVRGQLVEHVTFSENSRQLPALVGHQ